MCRSAIAVMSSSARKNHGNARDCERLQRVFKTFLSVKL